MKKIELLAPVKKPEDIETIKDLDIKGVYVYHNYFLKNGFDKIKLFYDAAKSAGFEFYINFKHSISEKELNDTKKIITYLQLSPIDGVMINAYAMLELLKVPFLPFKVIIDSGLNVHNLATIEFIDSFITPEKIALTEEVYLKNISKIEKYSKYKFAVNSDNLPWCIEDIKKASSIDMVTIKGDFDTAKKLHNGIKLIRNIIDNPAEYKDKKLPFKQPKTTAYESNHFLGRFISEEGKEFSFRGNIKKYDWDFKGARLAKNIDLASLNLPKLNLKLKSIDQINALKQFIKKYNFNPVNSIEYGEILSTTDLAKNSFNSVMEKVKSFCLEYQIKLELSTPKILLERDFDRVYEHVLVCKKDLAPSSIIVNNVGFWWNMINDNDFSDVDLEIGQGMNLLSSMSIMCLANQHKVSAVDLSVFTSMKNLKYCMPKIVDKIPTRKLTVGGNIRVQSSGLCPLNKDPVVLSRLSCSAPCQRGEYAVFDPDLQKFFPIAVDGFCRMHMFKNQVLDIFKYVPKLEMIGVNEFCIDFNSLPAKLVPILLTRFINAQIDPQSYKPDINFIDNIYGIEQFFEGNGWKE